LERRRQGTEASILAKVWFRTRRVLPPTFLVAVALAGYLGWRSGPGASDMPSLLALPPDQALRLEVNPEAARDSGPGTLLLEALLRSRFGSDARQAGLTDSRLLLLSLDAHGAYLAAQGRFPEERLRALVERWGGVCRGSLRETPCSFAGSPQDHAGRTGWLLLPADDRLLLAYAGSEEAVRAMVGRATPVRRLLSALRGEIPQRSPWMASLTVDPGRLAPIMSQPHDALPNLLVLAKALEKAVRAHFFLREGENGDLLLHLEAESPTASEAEQLRGLLAGLNDFAAAAAGYGRGEDAPSDWSTLLGTARFEQEGSAVKGAWTIERELLRRLVGANPLGSE
jgi:hypothetical protein